MLTIAPLLNKVNRFILNPLIILLFSVALLTFLWGLVELIMHADSDEGRETGRRNIFYGLLGMLIMIGVYGIIRLILSTFGIPNPGYIPV